MSSLLDPILNDAKVIVAVGSGGVGKTTTAASIAIAAARKGRKVAVLTIDPAKRLAQALGIEAMGNDAQPLHDDLVAPGSVDAMMLETGAAFDDLIARLVPDEKSLERLVSNRLYQVIARQLGGTHEYMAVEKLYALTRENQYDLVVLDTPPSVNALDFLDAPNRLTHFFSERITRFFVKRKDEQKRGLLKRLRDRAGEFALNLLGKALGATFIEEMQDFATAFAELFNEFRLRGMVINDLLKSKDARFLIVSGADSVRVEEAIEFAEILKKIDINPAAFLVNRVHADEGQLAKSLATLETQAIDEDLKHELMNAGAMVRSLMARDTLGLERLRRESKTQNIVVVPELDREVGDRNAIEHVITSLGVNRASK